MLVHLLEAVNSAYYGLTTERRIAHAEETRS